MASKADVVQQLTTVKEISTVQSCEQHWVSDTTGYVGYEGCSGAGWHYGWDGAKKAMCLGCGVTSSCTSAASKAYAFEPTLPLSLDDTQCLPYQVNWRYKDYGLSGQMDLPTVKYEAVTTMKTCFDACASEPACMQAVCYSAGVSSWGDSTSCNCYPMSKAGVDDNSNVVDKDGLGGSNTGYVSVRCHDAYGQLSHSVSYSNQEVYSSRAAAIVRCRHHCAPDLLMCVGGHAPSEPRRLARLHLVPERRSHPPHLLRTCWRAVLTS